MKALKDFEIETLKMLASGLTTKEIADKECIADTGVRARYRRLKRKYGLRTDESLIAFALANNLVENPWKNRMFGITERQRRILDLMRKGTVFLSTRKAWFKQNGGTVLSLNRSVVRSVVERDLVKVARVHRLSDNTLAYELAVIE